MKVGIRVEFLVKGGEEGRKLRNVLTVGTGEMEHEGGG